MVATNRLIHTLVIRRPTFDESALDEYGQPTASETPLETVRGLVQPKKVRELALISDAGAAIGEYTIFMEETDINEADRIYHDGSIYQITGVRQFAFGSLRHLEVDARLVTSEANVTAGGS